MNRHKTIGCTKFDCCQYDADPATCDDDDCPQRCDEPTGFKKWINKVIKNNIFSKLWSFLFNKKKKTPHCGQPPHCGCPPSDGIGCGCAFALFFFWFWLPVMMFVLKFGGGKKKKSPNTVKINSTENKPRVAFISVYNTPCGISTYNEQLIEELKQYADVRVFAEYADDVKSEKIEGDDEFVTRCWHRSEHPKVQLMQLVDEWKPDLIHFGHEYGFFAKAYLFTSLVSWFKSRKYPIIATMHSIYEHRDKTVHEASGQHIIAHTESGRQCLLNKGIDNDKITVIPHGSNIFDGDADNPKLLSPLWNTWDSEHTMFQPGFLFEYKGHLKMLGVVARLKEKYNDVHYIIQGSENPNNAKEHERVFRKLVNECKKLNIEENVTINRGFVTNDVLMSFIRTTKVCVLPYVSHPEHDVCSTSGIARVVVGTKTPLVTTKVHLFDDVCGVSFQAGTDDELYNVLDKIFSEPAIQVQYDDARLDFLKKTSWKSVAKMHFDLYSKVLRS